MDSQGRSRLGWPRGVIVFTLCSVAGMFVPSVNAEHFIEIEQRETLRGLSEMGLEVNLGFSREGPSRRLLRRDIEQKLHQLPIRILPETENDSTQFPAFVIDVSVLKTGDHSYFFLATARVYQEVMLDRDRDIAMPAVTWKNWKLGDGNFSNIRETVSELVRRFIDDYRGANLVD